MLRPAGPVAVAVKVTVWPTPVAVSVLDPAIAPSVQLTLTLPVRSVVTVTDGPPPTDPPPDCTAKVTEIPLEDGLP